MSESKLDEAVEVGVIAYWDDCANGPGYEDSYRADRGHMRAALLAGVKVLLGEPVAWLFRAGSDCRWQVSRTEDEVVASKDVYVRAGFLMSEYRPVYAPDLGGGG